MNRLSKTWLFRIAIVAAVAVAVFVAWRSLQPEGLPDGFASSNGRIEATEIDVAAKIAGRVEEILADEGDFVRAGQILARMDTNVLEAQRREAEAQLAQAQISIEAAEAQSAAAEAAIGSARSQIIDAQAAVEAAKATIQRIQADIGDSELRSPRDGRVQYRVAEPGEVLNAGGVVLNMVDLGDVYMTFFLPTEEAGRVPLGAEVRLVLDAVPQYALPAQATFVADVAQFTPKTVETAEERQKLMFRIRAQIDPGLLQKHLHQVKTGLPGMAYVRLDPEAEWPPELQNLPPA
jgi:HlyD family secretion protein